jgi:hypothetical protein
MWSSGSKVVRITTFTRGEDLAGGAMLVEVGHADVDRQAGGAVALGQGLERGQTERRLDLGRVAILAQSAVADDEGVAQTRTPNRIGTFGKLECGTAVAPTWPANRPSTAATVRRDRSRVRWSAATKKRATVGPDGGPTA